MASPTQWTWVWVNSGSWWWTGRLACCSPRGCKESDTTEWLNWTICIHRSLLFCFFFAFRSPQRNWVDFPVLYRKFSLVVYFIRSSVSPCLPIHPITCPPFPSCDHTSVLHFCVSISPLQRGSSVPFSELAIHRNIDSLTICVTLLFVVWLE